MPAWSIVPQSVWGAWIPRPRKPSAERKRIASATENVATVTMLLIEFGKTWRRMMWSFRAPMAVAAWEYSRLRIKSASLLMMRALPHHNVKPMMQIRNTVERLKIAIRVINKKM